tara:strand:- start:37 stop:336 length:300 start_codon:yes stop_codon:yes gene_type:complete
LYPERPFPSTRKLYAYIGYFSKPYWHILVIGEVFEMGFRLIFPAYVRNFFNLLHFSRTNVLPFPICINYERSICNEKYNHTGSSDQYLGLNKKNGVNKG